ncbi:VRR-NUC domain-containing protein [Microcella sp.]|uniref:VRR-NUC domain-containing protein n=1 Tax=Microcella sp. TaxID=1913979 RepID=UPI00391D54B1
MEAASISEADYHAMKAAEMPEKRLQDNVIGVARTLGWRVYHTYSSVRSEPGYPDLHLLHARHKVSALIELKTMKGKLSPAQQTWLRDLHTAGVAVAVWRPIHWYTHQIHDWLANPRTVELPGRLA